MIDIEKFIEDQLSSWPLARDNYRALADVRIREVGNVRVQFNPARIRSTGAKVDAETVRKRACFLCSAHRPKEQGLIDWGDYEILVNPYPIFPKHLTIPAKAHTPQSIKGRMADMCRLAAELQGYVVFYNGPKCGASAPDHMHFQAGNADFLPAEFPAQAGVFVINASTPEDAQEQMDRLYDKMPSENGEEPMMNILCRYVDGKYKITVVPRKRHRPVNYGDGQGQMLISPATVDLAGVFITPREKDFFDLKAEDIDALYSQMCYTPDQLECAIDKRRSISVGIMSADMVEMNLHGQYLFQGDPVTGLVSLDYRQVKNPLLFLPLSKDCYAELHDVTIGINFHWERRESQRFLGKIKIVPIDDALQVINVVSVEDYLTSVISSEMSATSQLELLKAHAVISRSWALNQCLARCKSNDHSHAVSCQETPADDLHPQSIVRWYGGNDHTLFDVCADDHCQRYQGITRQTTPLAAQAVKETEGQVLMSDGEICDTRFYKCCGGAFEEFENCWEPVHKSYLIGKRDWSEGDLPDLRDEAIARTWIMSAPDSFCNTSNKEVLSQVLNSYDQETHDFYRWTVEYDTETLSELVARKSGIDFGRILDMVPLQRGTSGRIYNLRIVGENKTVDIGKELEIRRILSESHLYSSAFVVEKTASGFKLYGAGWGHGVGLCQIGAAMMASEGYRYQQILEHYYPGAKIEKLND